MLPPIVTKMIMPDLADKEMAYVAISSLLLPPGMMGIMIASMFAATMSSLNAEYNVIASVLSKDFYQRLINSKATDRQLLNIAKISTILVGLLTLLGAMYISDFGGAFEANKLFTGIFAIPAGIPLVLGIISKRPTTAGALLTVILGAVTGIILNSFPDILSWELATAIEIVVCLLIFYGSALWKVKSKSYNERVQNLFIRLATPITNIPEIDKKFKHALKYLYSLSFVLSGILFIGLGVLSINSLSGALATGSGLACLFVAFVLWFFTEKKVPWNSIDKSN